MRQVLIAVLLVLSGGPWVSAQERNPIVGVWRAVSRESADGKTIANIPPAMRMFTARHYTWIASPIERPAVAFDKATDAQKIALWNFVAEIGTYEMKGSNVITQVAVGRDPGRTTSAYSEEFTFKIDGGRLYLRTVRPALGLWTTYERVE